MKPLVLYCKSYRTDLRRVVRLAISINRFNLDNIPFLVSVPSADLPLFREHLDNLNVGLLSDEEILRASPRINPDTLFGMPGRLIQQVVKSEFWRLNMSESYLCLDSDSIFIRPFHTRDYLDEERTPYSVINEARDLLNLSLINRKNYVVENFYREAKQLQEVFKRQGKTYSFGPMPLVWHRDVWASLDQNYLKPNDMSFVDAILVAPLESRWYGEAHLKYKAVPLLPSEPFFKVYHYAWQLDQDRSKGINEQNLAKIFSGVIYQSSWDRSLDWPTEGGNKLSRLGRSIRRAMGRT